MSEFIGFVRALISTCLLDPAIANCSSQLQGQNFPHIPERYSVGGNITDLLSKPHI